MKFSINEIKNNAIIEPYTFKRTVDVSHLETSENNDIKRIRSVLVEGICIVDKDELIFSFTIKGEMILPCARTLVDVNYPFQIEGREIFTTSQKISEEDEKNEVHQLLEDTLDFTPYIYEAIILATPYRVFSNEKGVKAGEGWSFYLEDEHQIKKQDRIDPRFAKLKRLIDKKEK